MPNWCRIANFYFILILLTFAKPKHEQNIHPQKINQATQAAALTSQTDNAASRHGKALVIVESPAKAKTINKYLGKDFIVRSL